MTAFLIFAGFVFSEDEPTALMQFDGGPCAVIAQYVKPCLSKNPKYTKSSLTPVGIFTTDLPKVVNLQQILCILFKICLN
jgi:hypothetical protein